MIASCQSRPCGEEEDPVYYNVGDDFNPTDAYYFLDTVADSYNDAGEIRAGVY